MHNFDELCSSNSLLSFTCYCVPYIPFLLYTTLSRGLSRHHHVVQHVIHTTPISLIPCILHTQSTYSTHVDNITSLLHYTNRATHFLSSKIKIRSLSHFQNSYRGLLPLPYPYNYILPSSLDSTGFMIKLATYTMLLSYPSK